MPADAHDGDYKGQIKNKRRDKLGQIFTALNDMSATLSENMQTIITQTNEARKEAKEAEEASVATKTALQKAETAKADGMHQAGSQLEGIAEEISSSSINITERTNKIHDGVDVQKPHPVNSNGYGGNECRGRQTAIRDQRGNQSLPGRNQLRGH